MYSESIFKEALDADSDGIVVNGQIINNIRYADDTVLIAENMDGLQRLLDQVNTASNNHGLKMNIKKTKYMIISKNYINPNSVTLKVGTECVERVQQYKYLGCYLKKD